MILTTDPPAASPALLRFVADVTGAAKIFGSLTDAELEATPAKAREGISAVFGALADYTDGSSYRD